MGRTLIYQSAIKESFALFDQGFGVQEIFGKEKLNPLPGIATLYRWRKEWESKKMADDAASPAPYMNEENSISNISRLVRYEDNEEAQRIVGLLGRWLKDTHKWAIRKSNSRRVKKWYFGPLDSPRRFSFGYTSSCPDGNWFHLQGGSFYGYEKVYRGVAERLGCEIHTPETEKTSAYGLANVSPVPIPSILKGFQSGQSIVHG